ncbi:hydrolase involved in interstrand cross-link repair [Nannochloropsis gaditana CCMP526]|uniref:hydrolase involved in interstrand cross-link repair n=1 Tax=Nannochloropsis gaditana (strain CCMP526) TaxID=1093141 RepID=UPI00029F56F0|nr:hydrolase involved in interstrand cross-link repair [Nannochloropsis gaditana CCMP526]EKU20432.1 hydrolase involved in interstrand cross-link repair [Nannochloropsis gaditana CCMP526]|eukprot:XP_005855931.1 hydrolase involved in interstrand cross-link repair [Nannochloropsis gaditana CCMP526]
MEEEEGAGVMEEEEEEEEEKEGDDACRPVVGFRPTGWSYLRNRKTARDACPSSPSSYTPWVNPQNGAKLYWVPYSEHSSYTELRSFVRAIRPRKIIPTVGAGDEKGVERQLKHFLADMDLSHDRSRLDRYLGRGEEKRLKILPPNKRRLEGGVGGKRKTFDFEKIDVEEQVLRWEELSKGLNSDGKVQERGRGWDEREFTSDTKEKGLGRKTVEVIVLDDDDN